MNLTGSRTNPSLGASRFPLKPGRKYEEAVKSFAPDDRVQEVNQSARDAGKKLIAEAKKEKKKTLICVNNRLERIGLETIAAMLDEAAS
jgi:hypothetical protein